MTIDQKKTMQIQALVGIVTIIGGLTALFLYFDKRKHSKIQVELDTLDKEIKELQLAKLKKNNNI
jgi:hypothetical protein